MHRTVAATAAAIVDAAVQLRMAHAREASRVPPMPAVAVSCAVTMPPMTAVAVPPAAATARAADAPHRTEPGRMPLLPAQPLPLALERAQLLAQQARAVARTLCYPLGLGCTHLVGARLRAQG